MARETTHTREITQTKETTATTYRASEPEYIKIYIKDIMYLADLPEGYTKILYSLLSQASWANDGMRVTVTAGLKRLMCKEVGFKNPQSITNAISQMTKGKILKRIETGVYALNPYLFGKGDWRDIEKLRLNVEYRLDGEKKFRAAIEYKGRKEINITPPPGVLQARQQEGGVSDGNENADTASAES